MTRLVLCVSCAAAFASLFAAAACSPPPPMRDVVEEFPARPDGCTGASCFDAGGDRTPPGDGGGDDAPADVADLDAPDTGGDAADAREELGPCTMGFREVVPQPRGFASTVFVAPAPGDDGYAAALRTQRGGVDNVTMLFAPLAAGAMLGPVGDVTMEVGSTVAGGALARDGTSWVVAYSSNRVNGVEVYLRRAAITMMMGSTRTVTPAGAPARVSNDTLLSENPRVVATPTGWTVVWRSRNDMTGALTLTAAAVASATLTASAPVTIPLTGVPGSYELVADGPRTALVYVDTQTMSADVVAVQLDATGAVMGAPIALTSMARVSDAVSAVLRGDELVVLWREVARGAALHARRVNLATGAAAAETVDLAALGTNVAGAGITRDATSFALGFRETVGSASRVRMVRLDATSLAPREAPSLAGTSPVASGDAVRVATRGDGTFALGWTDPEATAGMPGSVLQVMRCP